MRTRALASQPAVQTSGVWPSLRRRTFAVEASAGLPACEPDRLKAQLQTCTAPRCCRGAPLSPRYWAVISATSAGTAPCPRSLACAILAAVLTGGLLRAAEASQPVGLILHEPWQALFAGRQVVLHLSLRGAAGADGRVPWSLRSAAGTLLRGEEALPAKAGDAVEVAVRIALPPVKEGVIMPVDLEASAILPAQPPEAAPAFSRRLWLFPEDPFANRREWLRSLRLRLFDPAGPTTACLTQATVPFETVTNLAALEGQPPAVLIVGAGTPGRAFADQAAALLRLAAQGHRVLTLAVTGAEFPIPGSAEPDLPQPLRVDWRQGDVITELDKRLDAAAWPPDGTLPAALLQVTTRGSQVIGRLATDAPGWPWFAARFPSGGCFVICGFPLIDRWEAGPTPRFLFARVLEWLATTEPDPTDVTAPQR